MSFEVEVRSQDIERLTTEGAHLIEVLPRQYATSHGGHHVLITTSHARLVGPSPAHARRSGPR